MDRQANGLGLVGQGAFDGLLDPPGAIRRELATFGGIETFNGFHQPYVAFADQIQQRQADPFIIAGDFYDEPQVGLDHLFARSFIAFLDASRQFDLLLRRQEFDLTDLTQVEFDGSVAVITRAFASAWLRSSSYFG